ncbi:MAG: TIGR00282 family metallophosphoesterase [Bacteroidota bacterium]
MSSSVTLLFLGDIVGEEGMQCTRSFLPSLIQKHKADFVIANGENSHEGHGINEEIIEELIELGVHVITGGDHSFDKWKVFTYMRQHHHILRPLNYPSGNPGYGFGVFDVPNTPHKIGVINVQGRTFMKAIDDPFKTIDWAIDHIQKETKLLFIDFHAEATAEKVSMAWHVDGRASILAGTHTHIPTGDARIFPKGLGYITDAGMTGSYGGSLGMDVKVALKRFTMGVHQKYKPSTGDAHLSGIIAKIETETGKCTHIEHFVFPSFNNALA